MPSSLLARVKAAQSSSSSSRSTAISSSSTAAPETTSKKTSLAAAAASKIGTQVASSNTTTSVTNNYVPSYKLNPLNAASISPYSSSSVSVGIINDNAVRDAVKIKAVTETSAAVDHSSSNGASNKDEIIIETVQKMVVTSEKTIMEQLLQSQKNQQPSHHHHHLPNEEYFMCSQSEAIDRQQHLELSPFECDPSSLHLGNTPQCFPAAPAARRRPIFHPKYVVKKYRRSAAGGGTLSEESSSSIRKLEQLDKTVEYLIEDIFVWQKPPPLSTSISTSSSCVAAAGGKGSDDPNEISIWEENGHNDDYQPQLPQQMQIHHTPFSLSDTVAFIDDRLRAVQKDLVTLLGNLEHHQDNYHTDDVGSTTSHGKGNDLQIKQTVRKMQAKMVRYSILSSYLLSDVPSSKYEVKFGARALRTSLTCYLTLSSTLNDDYYDIAAPATATAVATQLQYKEECKTKDEMMAYMALLHSSAVIRSKEHALPQPAAGEVTSSLMEESGSGWGALLSTFCKSVVDDDLAVDAANGRISHDFDNDGCHQSLVAKYPRWKWALQMACMAQEGNSQGYFKLLQTGPSNVSSSSGTTALTSEEEVKNARFLLLARCCASHSLSLIRLGQLRRYNHSFGKGEKVSGKDLARLLHFNTPNLAIDFCRDAGLPIVEKEGSDDESIELYVAMKSVPISISQDESIKRMCNPGRRNDCFVFGSCMEDTTSREDVASLKNRLNSCGLREKDVEDWEEDIEADDDVKKSGLSNISTSTIEARIDEDGVVIPSSQVIRTLMQ